MSEQMASNPYEFSPNNKEQIWLAPGPDVTRQDSSLNDLITRTHEEILRPDSILPGLGLSAADTAEKSVTLPTVEHLNSVLESVGRTDREFVEIKSNDEGFVSAQHFLQPLSEGQIPIGTRPFYRLHDTAVHAPIFIEMPARLMKMVRKTAKGALASGNNNEMERVAGEIDVFAAYSDTDREPSFGSLAKAYGHFMKIKLFAGIMARKDIGDMQRVHNLLRQKTMPHSGLEKRITKN